MTTLLLGSLPGLRARGAPVVYASGPTPIRGIVTGYAPADSDALDVSWDGGVISRTVLPSALALDMDDPAGMDRAARYLAERVGLVCGATAPSVLLLPGLMVPLTIHIGSRVERPPGEVEAEFWVREPPPSKEGRRRYFVPELRGVIDPAAALALAVLACAR